MIGVVLAAGMGSRLRPYTDNVPKTLIPLKGDQTILDTILANLVTVGLRDVAIVVGYAADAVEDALPAMKEQHGLDVTLIYNDHPEWNNAYSLWLARTVYASGALLVNGDTMHPVAVEQSLLARRAAELLITVDTRKSLNTEAMKVQLDRSGAVVRITKQLLIAEADGEYIGTSLIAPEAAEGLTDALEATWRADRSLYYEDAYQTYVDRGATVAAVDPGPIEWVEVDDHHDLALARDLACRS